MIYRELFAEGCVRRDAAVEAKEVPEAAGCRGHSLRLSAFLNKTIRCNLIG